MPEEGKACHDPHYVNKDYSGEADVACAPSVVGIKAEEQIHDAELIKKVEELIEEPRFAKAIDLRDVFFAFRGGSIKHSRISYIEYPVIP